MTASSGRGEVVERAVAAGLEQWRRARAVTAIAGEPVANEEESGRTADASPPDDVRAPLPRRRPFELRPGTGSPPYREQLAFKATFFAAVSRLGLWLYVALVYVAGTLLDALRRKNSPQRRAVRLRRTLERIGGTFLKVGQQMSIRIDLLPAVYCSELAKLLDQVPPFPSDEAVAIIERTTGRPLAETFAVFDPEPIGSASLACVYQARLINGARVAVKVRRPRIVETFASDWRALSWIVGLLELLTLVRPGQLGPMLHDLGTMFLEETDFHKEGQYTELFKRRAKQSRLRFLTAPEVYFEHSSTEVLVTEFVSGVWLWEILGAVEGRNEEALAYMQRLGVDPRQVARRLFRASLFGIFENLIFHADPHPANVVVRPGNEIVLIDFGSCGSYTGRQLHILRQLHYYQAQEDVGGMVQCALALLEPLPPIDVDALTRYVEVVFADSLYSIKSKGSEWWERTSAGVWIGFMKVARQYHVRVNLDTLRMIRSTLQYDTLAARLYRDLDVYEEYQRYRKKMASGARRRFRKRARQFVRSGLDDRLFLRGEELLDLGARLTYRLQRYADSPAYKFSALAGKAVFAASTAVRWATLTLTLGVLGGGVLVARRVAAGGEVRLTEIAGEVAGNVWFLSGVGLLLAINLRRVLFRFSDKDV